MKEQSSEILIQPKRVSQSQQTPSWLEAEARNDTKPSHKSAPSEDKTRLADNRWQTT